MIRELTELGTMITVLLGASAGVHELLAQRGFRSRRQDLELEKLRLEIRKLQSDLGEASVTPNIQELEGEHKEDVSPASAGVGQSALPSMSVLMSPFERVWKSFVAITMFVSGTLFALAALLALFTPDEGRFFLLLFFSALAGVALPVGAAAVSALNADSRIRSVQSEGRRMR